MSESRTTVTSWSAYRSTTLPTSESAPERFVPPPISLSGGLLIAESSTDSDAKGIGGTSTDVEAKITAPILSSGVHGCSASARARARDSSKLRPRGSAPS